MEDVTVNDACSDVSSTNPTKRLIVSVYLSEWVCMSVCKSVVSVVWALLFGGCFLHAYTYSLYFYDMISKPL